MDFIGLYAKFLKKFLKLKSPLTVVFDCSNGTAGLVIKKLKNLENKKLRIVLINDKPDGNFPAHGPNPMQSGALADLQKAVRTNKADLGIIFDADGDRVFFADNSSRSLNPDAAAALISRNFEGPVILDVRSGYPARELIAADGKPIIDSRVGHYFIKKLMRRKKINFAAELSGHYYFKDFFFADSAIFAAIQMINQASVIKRKGLSLSRYVNGLPKYFSSGEINFRVKNKKSMLKKIESRYKNQAKKISHLDGVKMEFVSPAEEWWFNVRPSNTEDLLRLNLEAKERRVFNFRLREIKKILTS